MLKIKHNASRSPYIECPIDEPGNRYKQRRHSGLQ